MSTDSRAAPHPDPRPHTVDEAGRVLVAGLRCASCGRASAVAVARCAKCFAPVDSATFGPGGQVWSSTLLHVSLGGRPTPTCLAYVDLDDGPRVLARVTPTPEQRPVVGTSVTLVSAADDSGDLFVTVTP